MTNSEQLLLLAARIGAPRANADGYTHQIGYTYAAPIGNLSATDAAIKAAALTSGVSIGGGSTVKIEQVVLNSAPRPATTTHVQDPAKASNKKEKVSWWAGIVAWFKEKPARYGWLALLLAAVGITTIKAKKG